MTLAELSLTVHVVAAVAWVGAGLFELFLYGRMTSAGPEAAVAYIGAVEDAGKKYFMPLSILTLLSGISTVLLMDYSFGEPFVSIGFLGIIVGAALGAGVMGRTAVALGEAIEAGDEAQVGPLRSKLATFSRVEVAILVIVVAVMVIRPGT